MDFSDIKDLPPLIFYYSPPILPESISLLTSVHLPCEIFFLSSKKEDSFQDMIMIGL